MVTLIAASTAVAVLVTLRLLGAEMAARRAAPFLVFGPAAIWQAVSADAMFAAVAAWGIAALAAAATRRSVPWAIVAGLLLGYCVMLSYGLPLLGVLAVAVLVVARTWRPLPWAVLGALAVVLTFAALGFVWWEALPVLRERYWDGVAEPPPGVVLDVGQPCGTGVQRGSARRRRAGHARRRGRATSTWAPTRSGWSDGLPVLAW